jgi:hypothetical protein
MSSTFGPITSRPLAVRVEMTLRIPTLSFYLHFVPPLLYR